MSDAKHTPGPWEAGGIAGVALTFDREINIFPPDAEKTGGYQYAGPIAVVSASDDAGGTANAHLIAAAPDLLAACETVLAKLDYLQNLWGGEGVTRSVADQILAAIAKAKGGAA